MKRERSLTRCRPRRRTALLAALAAGLVACGGGGGAGGGTTAKVTPSQSFAKVITPLMTKWGVPGGAVALVKDGRLVMAEGYGLADKTGSVAATADSLFRIASLSKPVTAAAALKLVEAGRLGLDDKAFAILSDLRPPPGATVDPRLADITVRDLLQHSGGWDRNASFDPMFKPREIAAAMGVATPPDAETIIRYMMGQPLDFTPATKYVYSNFGYCVLGRIIERVSGESYQDCLQEAILGPAGIGRMKLGRSLAADRASGEVAYYDYPGAPLTPSVFGEAGDLVPWPYGGFAIEPMDAHGGWIASAVDLVRFVTAVDGLATRPDVVQASTIALMTARPSLPDWASSDWYYALGWQVRPIGTGANWWHTGSLPGTVTIMVRAHNGLAWAALFNTRPADADAFTTELDSALWTAVGGVTDWPTTDLFDSHPSPAGTR
ncbi:MAG TPA: serine hydrolase domain-containing protein [Terriglobales bacterium]|nr:serine hydrolase domain-containing protein [Terriglobales bacterium]